MRLRSLRSLHRACARHTPKPGRAAKENTGTLLGARPEAYRIAIRWEPDAFAGRPSQCGDRRHYRQSHRRPHGTRAKQAAPPNGSQMHRSKAPIRTACLAQPGFRPLRIGGFPYRPNQANGFSAAVLTPHISSTHAASCAPRACREPGRHLDAVSCHWAPLPGAGTFG